MVKRVLFSAIGLVAARVFFFGRDALESYVGTSIGKIKDSVKQSVPISFELRSNSPKMVKGHHARHSEKHARDP